MVLIEMSQIWRVFFVIFFMLFFVVALAQGYPSSERRAMLDEKMPDERVVVFENLFRPWQKFVISVAEIENEQSKTEPSPPSRAPTEFERTKEVNERTNRKPIVWRFDSFKRVLEDSLITGLYSESVDRQIRCLGLQCIRITFKSEPVIANCELSFY